DGDPVELLEGWLILKMSKSPLHSAVADLLRLALEAAVPAGFFVRTQEPVTTADSEPEPDGVVIRGDRRDFLTRHPGPGEIALVVEVADTSLRRDHSLKLRVYARAGIPTYWIVNLVDRRVEVYTAPGGPGEDPGYTDRRDYSQAEAIPLTLDAETTRSIPVTHLLP
ncbi:MAG TPA: Uma2 family endonuclease, partial [Armatimonadota bacterium]|nr:Uma2 family endonuclease [Armatimonadota bacterium]